MMLNLDPRTPENGETLSLGKYVLSSQTVIQVFLQNTPCALAMSYVGSHMTALSHTSSNQSKPSLLST